LLKFKWELLTNEPTYTTDYAGESRQIRLEGNILEGLLLIALVFVYLVLAVQFNSFRDPLVVLLGSVPLALSDAIMFAFLDFTTINIYSQVGLISSLRCKPLRKLGYAQYS
jgi:multidrug efflux pump